MFGRKSRAEKLKREAEKSSLVPLATLGAVYAGARPVAERLLYDDDLRDNIRAFIQSARNIYDQVSGEDLDDVLAKLWDDKKLRSQIEAAAEAAQEGAKRVSGQKVRSGGGGSRLLLLLVLGAIGFIFLSPQTGEQARGIVKDLVSSLTG